MAKNFQEKFPQKLTINKNINHFKTDSKSADLSNFATDERTQYFEDMHTKEDIERMIAYAKKEGMAIGLETGRKEGREEGKLQVAKAC